MKQRHVFSTPDLPTAKAVIQAARIAGVPEEDIALVARSDIELESLPEQYKEAGDDFFPAAVRGLLGGGATGLLAGLVAIAIPPVGVTLAGVAGLTLAGALTGGWVSAMVGGAVPDPVRRRFEEEIEAGRILIAVDALPERFEQIEPALVQAGGRPLPYESPSALT